MSTNPHFTRVDVELGDDDFDAHLRGIVAYGDSPAHKVHLRRVWGVLVMRVVGLLLLLGVGYAMLDTALLS